MKKYLTRIIMLIPFLGVNWAVLHDITSGEPDAYLEYSIVVLSILLLAYIMLNRYVKLKQGRI